MRAVLSISVVLALVACTPSTEPESAEPEKPTQPAKPAEPEPPAKPETPPPQVEPDPAADANAVKLSPLQKEVTVPVGAKLTYSFNSHASVGFGATQNVADPAVVKYVRTDKDYDQSAEERANKDGADGGTGTFVFEAIAPGTAKVTVEELFRGDVESSTTFTITVTAK
jgi:hypothetical protein